MHEKKAKGILSSNNGMNIYRGCTHGCIYCDARSTCYQIQHAFEDVEVKVNAAELLEETLRRKRKKCMIGTGGMSDPYVHEEKQRGLTRKCLEIIEHYGFGLAIQTKSDMILRDLKLLKQINKNAKCVVQMTLTTYDEELCAKLEPYVCTTHRRVEVLKIMHNERIPTIVWMTPILPFINDTEENVKGLLDHCIQSKVRGILCFNMGLTLRDGDRQYYYKKLDEHFPGLKHQYIRHFGNAYEIPSPNNRKLLQLVRSTCKEHGMDCNTNSLFSYMRTFKERLQEQQMELF